ncbi:MAG: PASTA domain-containing protein [Bacteroidales bacterium]
MSILSFLKSKTFRYHVLYAIAAVIVLLWLSLKVLDIYTMHGRTIEVPNLDGLQTEQAERMLRRANLRAVINDSIFDSQREKGTIASQNPAPGIAVKKNRTVYLTTVAILPEMVAMPDLTDLSLRQALAVLETYGLKPGRLEYVPNIALNAVLQQKFNRATIEAGTLVEKGTAIDLVLGDGAGTSDNQVLVPLLIGKTREEAIQLLNSSSLNLGQEIFLDDDQEDLRVYRQSPSVQQRRLRVSPGTAVDLYYRSAAAFDFDTYLAENLSVTTPDLTGKTPEEVFKILQDNFLVLDKEVYEFNVPASQARVFRQDPDALDQPQVTRGTRFNIWYRRIEDFDRQ